MGVRKRQKKDKNGNRYSFGFPILPCYSPLLCGLERSTYFCTQKHAMKSK